MGQTRAELSQKASALEDSGYGSPPAKMPRVDNLEVDEAAVSSVIVDLLEDGYNHLYLCKSGSLQRSYETGTTAPFRDSPVKVQAARNFVPGWGRGLTSQFLRVENYRRKGRVVIEVIDIE